jgi:hypothetical protein
MEERMVRKIDRRSFLAGAGATLLLSGSERAATTILGPATPMGVPTRAWVEQPTIVRQQCPERCWAASISMIFAAYGHPIDQKKIVAKTFGSLVCAAAGSPTTMGVALSQSWVDDNGTPFDSQVVAAYDVMNGINAIDNSYIVDELASDRPLLYANTHRAMVNVTVEYFDTPNGPDVRGVGVLDPWPYNPAFHMLSPPEMVPAHLGGQMTFLASVRIS